MKFTSQQIAKLLQGKLEGDKNVELNTFSKIEDAKPNSLSFLANSKYESYIYNTKASVVLVNNDFVPKQSLPNTLTLIKVDNAYESLAVLLNYYKNIEDSDVSKETKSETPEERNIIFIGTKPIMTYVSATLTQLSTRPSITIKARGKRITQAVDVSQMIIKRMDTVGYVISDVRISSDSLTSQDGKQRNVSNMEIDITKE